MARHRKRHVQLDLPKLDKNGQHRGGKRRGAGRKPKGARAGARHEARPVLDRRHPQHVTVRVVSDVGGLRRLDMYHAVHRHSRSFG